MHFVILLLPPPLLYLSVLPCLLSNRHRNCTIKIFSHSFCVPKGHAESDEEVGEEKGKPSWPWKSHSKQNLLLFVHCWVALQTRNSKLDAKYLLQKIEYYSPGRRRVSTYSTIRRLLAMFESSSSFVHFWKCNSRQGFDWIRNIWTIQSIWYWTPTIHMNCAKRSGRTLHRRLNCKLAVERMDGQHQSEGLRSFRRVKINEWPRGKLDNKNEKYERPLRMNSNFHWIVMCIKLLQNYI